MALCSKQVCTSGVKAGRSEVVWRRRPQAMPQTVCSQSGQVYSMSQERLTIAIRCAGEMRRRCTREQSKCCECLQTTKCSESLLALKLCYSLQLLCAGIQRAAGKTCNINFNALMTVVGNCCISDVQIPSRHLVSF